MTPFSYELRQTTLHVTGYLDERSVFIGVSGKFGGVNLQCVEGFSSIGLRQFLQFLYAQSASTIALHECPVSFIETINAISGLLKGKKIRIESFLVPYKCQDCLIEVEVLVRCSDVRMEGTSIKTPTPRCHSCREHLHLHVDPHEYFLFLYN